MAALIDGQEVTRIIYDAIDKLRDMIPKYVEATYPINLSGACKLHCHDSCGYSKCECLCHNTIPRSKVAAKIKEWKKRCLYERYY